MKAFKRAMLVGMVAVGVAAASASAAQAASVDATGAWTASAGTTQFTYGSSSISCSNSTASGNISSAVGLGGSTTLQLNFSGSCTAFGFVNVPVSCSAASLAVDSFPSGTEADGHVALPAQACTITVTVPLFGNCVIRVPASAAYASPTDSLVLDTSAQTVTVPPLSIPASASGTGCAVANIPSSGSGTFSNPSGGSVVYTHTAGETPWHIS